MAGKREEGEDAQPSTGKAEGTSRVLNAKQAGRAGAKQTSRAGAEQAGRAGGIGGRPGNTHPPERYGPLQIERYVKDDGRALILYTHAEGEQG
jgi:hypothetical protein